MEVYTIFGIVLVGSITEFRVCGTTCMVLPPVALLYLAIIYSGIKHAAVNEPMIPTSMQAVVKILVRFCDPAGNYA